MAAPALKIREEVLAVLWRLFRRANDDEGFTMVELIVTMVIIATVLLGLVGVQVSALATTAVAKQRQQATALANKAMEELRALPFATISGGLYSGDLASDPNISGGDFKPTYESSIDEVLVTSSNQPTPNTTPLYPHISSTTLDGVSYSTSTYVSIAPSEPGASQSYNLSVIVTWSSNATGSSTKTTAVRSRVYSPSGCLSTTDHPFSGPCENFLDGSAGTASAGVTLASTTQGAPLVQGLDLDSAALFLPKLSAGVQSEQVISASATPATSGGSFLTSAGNQDWDAAGDSTLADTDPSTGDSASSQSQSVTQSGAEHTTSSVNGWSLTVGDGSDNVTSTSTLEASGATNCVDTAGSTVTNANPCGSAAVTSGGGSVVLELPSESGQRSVTVASIANGPQPNYSFSTLYTSPTGSYCAGTSGVGCVHSGSDEYFGDISLGGIGSGGSVTTGFVSYLFTISGYHATATAESGIGSLTSGKSLSGTLSYWNGTGYSSAPLSTPFTYSTDWVTATYSNNIEVKARAQIAVTGGQVKTDGSAPCDVSACSVQTTSGGVMATITYEVYDQSGTLTADFTATVNLGAALARSSYKAATS